MTENSFTYCEQHVDLFLICWMICITFKYVNKTIFWFYFLHSSQPVMFVCIDFVHVCRSLGKICRKNEWKTGAMKCQIICITLLACMLHYRVKMTWLCRARCGMFPAFLSWVMVMARVFVFHNEGIVSTQPFMIALLQLDMNHTEWHNAELHSCDCETHVW